MCSFVVVDAQLLIKSTDFKRIHHKKLRELLHKQKNEGVTDFCQINSTCYNRNDSNSYSLQSSSSIIKGEINTIWNKIRSIKPQEEFCGDMVKFGFLFSKRLNRLFYNDEQCQELEEGQIIFVNLKLLRGIFNLGVALKVTKIDDENKTIQFCYIKNGKSEGTQEVRLTSTSDGNSILIQETRYKSASRFRDKNLYPKFHSKAINEIHHNLRRVIESSNGKHSQQI